MTEEDADEVAEWQARQLAEFCVFTGFTPDVFYGLSVREHQAFIKAHNQKNKGGK